MKKAFFYLVIFLCIQFVVQVIILGVGRLVTGHSVTEEAWATILSNIISCLLIIVLFLWRRWTVISPDYLKTRPWMVILWTIVASLGTLLPSLWLQEMMPELIDFNEELMRKVLNTPGAYVAIGVIAPIAEEVVFRGGVLRTLLSWTSGRWKAIVISALLFALAHMNPAQMPHAFLMGLLLGWLYARTHSLIPCTVFHITNNTGAILMEKLYPNVERLQDFFTDGNDLTVIKAVGFSMLILIPAIYQLHVWMKHGTSSKEQNLS